MNPLFYRLLRKDKKDGLSSLPKPGDLRCLGTLLLTAVALLALINA